MEMFNKYHFEHDTLSLQHWYTLIAGNFSLEDTVIIYVTIWYAYDIENLCISVSKELMWSAIDTNYLRMGGFLENTAIKLSRRVQNANYTRYLRLFGFHFEFIFVSTSNVGKGNKKKYTNR